MDDAAPGVLALIEVDGKRAYVFESPLLPVMRGASDLIRISEHETMRLLPPGHRIIAEGGGHVLAWMPEEADPARWEAAVVATTKGGTTATAATAGAAQPARPLPPLFSSAPAGYASQLSLLHARLHERKARRDCVPFLPVHPTLERCMACQHRPAAHEQRVFDEIRLLCSPCQARYEQGRAKDGQLNTTT